MSQRNKQKFYVVWAGHQPGVYAAWADAARQVSGYPQAKHKSFNSKHEAESAFRGTYWDYAGKDTTTFTKSLDELASLGISLDSVAVDAACSGNPGKVEYRGVHVRTGAELFRVGPYEDGTNNIGEFLAVVHALAFLKKQGKPDVPVYSDSINAQKWVRERDCRTGLERTPRNVAIFDLITRAVSWLSENPITNPILKWDTEKWGEIPADFGRK